jgi:succinate-acetate transporter protein
MENKLSNPAPLGLMAFGMTTVLLNLHNAGIFGLGSMILAMGIFYGGIAQVIAGIMEFKKGNTFGTTAFTSYGLFWLSLVALVVLPSMIEGVEGPALDGMVAYLIMWGIFTLWMFISTLKTNRLLQFVFLSLAILFFLLAAGEYNTTIHMIAGYEGIICGFSAMYLSMAEVMNEMYGKVMMPIWPSKKE